MSRTPGKMPRCLRRAALLMLSSLAACSLAPSYEVPDQPVPARWENGGADAAATLPGTEWWRRYGSSELADLMTRALGGNHDLAAAVSRIEQARASLQAARAALWPFAVASASASQESLEADGETLSSDDGRIGLAIDYDVDLWAANRNAGDAAALRLAVSRFNRNAVALALQADVAAAYFQLLALQDRMAIAETNLQAARELLRLIQVRFDNGAATALDLAQQRASLLGIEAQLPALQQGAIETRNALAVLVGSAPEELTVTGRSLADVDLPNADPGVPVELLTRRPDIRAAEAALLAANADIGVARAALLPGVGLSASAAATGLVDGGSATVATISASLAQTLFDGGESRSRVALSRAVRQELAENYAQTVLLALQDVENALSSVTTSQRRVDLLTQTVEQAREAYRLSRVRFDAGAIDLLTVLDSQRTLLNAEDSLVLAKQEQLTANASLVEALGGGRDTATAE